MPASTKSTKPAVVPVRKRSASIGRGGGGKKWTNQNVESFTTGRPAPAAEPIGHEVPWRYPPRSTPTFKPPAKENEDCVADHGRRAGEIQQAKGAWTRAGDKASVGCAEGAAASAGNNSGRQRKAWPRRSRGGGAHSSMSVAEFADKVAALAADVAGVFGMYGRKSTSPAHPEMRTTACGVE